MLSGAYLGINLNGIKVYHKNKCAFVRCVFIEPKNATNTSKVGMCFVHKNIGSLLGDAFLQ